MAKDKLRRERKELEAYRDCINKDKSEVGMIETADGDCLGFSYTDVNGVLVYIYYHEPSLCYCIHRIGDEPREIALNYEY